MRAGVIFFGARLFLVGAVENQRNTYFEGSCASGFAFACMELPTTDTLSEAYWPCCGDAKRADF